MAKIASLTIVFGHRRVTTIFWFFNIGPWFVLTAAETWPNITDIFIEKQNFSMKMSTDLAHNLACGILQYPNIALESSLFETT